MKKLSFSIILLTSVFFSGAQEKEEVKIAPYFQSGMVIQQNQPVMVWGTANVGARIIAKLGNEKKVTKANKEGDWEVIFSSRKASFDKLSLKINNKTFNNILIGEVWLCSGQSNMNYKLENIDTYKSILDYTSNENLRILQHTNIRIVAKDGYSEEELERCNPQKFFQTEWAVSNTEVASKASAVAWLFGHKLQQKLNVPIGIIQVAVGGSALNNWIPPNALKTNPTTQSLFKNDWLQNKQVKLEHRQRAREAFQKVLKQDEPYIAGQFPYRWLCEPGFLFEAGIAPLQHLSFRGVLWYQGESDTGNSQMVDAAKELFPMMVNEWRSYFNNGDFPFIYVQLPGGGNDLWPEFREVQKKAQQELANMFMIVSIDLGEPKNGHPKDKQPIGERAVITALKYVYGFNELAGFPKLEKWILSKNEITLRFSGCGEGLQSTADSIPGFEVSGKNGVFMQAKAYISTGNTLNILSPVKKPNCLRYGWMSFPNPPLTLYNSEQLPLGPFRINLNK